MEMIDSEARSSKSEEENAPVIWLNGVEQGIKVGRPVNGQGPKVRRKSKGEW